VLSGHTLADSLKTHLQVKLHSMVGVQAPVVYVTQLIYSCLPSYISSKLSTAHQAHEWNSVPSTDTRLTSCKDESQKLPAATSLLSHLKIVVAVLVAQMSGASHGYKSHDHDSIQPHTLSLHLRWWCSDTTRGIQVEREHSYENT
jgi:hypothetical protein